MLLFLAIVQQYIIPLLIDEKIIKKIDNIENWHLFISSILAGLIIGLILNKKTRNKTIVALVVLVISCGIYFGVKNINFSSKKKQGHQTQNFDQPFFVFQDTIKKVLPEWNIIKHQFYLGNTIIILSSSGNLNYKKSWEAGDGRKFEMKLRNDGLYWGQIPIKYQILDPNTRYQVKINNYKGGEKLIFWIK
ncbi:hypothetical protein L6278_00775 [Candidatus Parcubacteria bacterium]|nr:hypothetical protein [Candidatus Parcubacteria bacterium]